MRAVFPPHRGSSRGRSPPRIGSNAALSLALQGVRGAKRVFSCRFAARKYRHYCRLSRKASGFFDSLQDTPPRVFFLCACLPLLLSVLPHTARKGMCARETFVGFPLHVQSPARRRPLLRSKSAAPKKKDTHVGVFLFWCGRRDSNPHTTKATEPKSVESTNSTTPAYPRRIVAHFPPPRKECFAFPLRI